MTLTVFPALFAASVLCGMAGCRCGYHTVASCHTQDYTGETNGSEDSAAECIALGNESVNEVA